MKDNDRRFKYLGEIECPQKPVHGHFSHRRIDSPRGEVHKRSMERKAGIVIELFLQTGYISIRQAVKCLRAEEYLKVKPVLPYKIEMFVYTLERDMDMRGIRLHYQESSLSGFFFFLSFPAEAGFLASIAFFLSDEG